MRTNSISTRPLRSRRTRPRHPPQQLNLLDIITRQDRERARQERKRRRLEKLGADVVHQPRLRMLRKAKIHVAVARNSPTKMEFLVDAHRNERYAA